MAILANNGLELHQKKMGYQKLIEMLKLQYVSVHRVFGLVEISNNKSQKNKQITMTKIQNLMILNKGKRIEKDIFINSGKIEIY